jgi:hypothetical protein
MSATTSDTLDLRALQDRFDVTDVLYKYAKSIDSFDREGLRSTLADDIHAQYGNLDPVDGGDALTEWIGGATSSIVWQHHHLSVFTVEVEGDSARALSYLISHQVFEGNLEEVKYLAARYHDELKRTAEGWKISRRVGEFLWAETRRVDNDFLSILGGRGPEVWPRP